MVDWRRRITASLVAASVALLVVLALGAVAAGRPARLAHATPTRVALAKARRVRIHPVTMRRAGRVIDLRNRLRVIRRAGGLTVSGPRVRGRGLVIARASTINCGKCVMIKNRTTGLCLSSASDKQGQPVGFYTCNPGSLAQYWLRTSFDANMPYLEAEASPPSHPLCLNTFGGGLRDDSVEGLWSCNTENVDMWYAGTGSANTTTWDHLTLYQGAGTPSHFCLTSGQDKNPYAQGAELQTYTCQVANSNQEFSGTSASGADATPILNIEPAGDLITGVGPAASVNLGTAAASAAALPSGGYVVAFGDGSDPNYDLMLYSSNGELIDTLYGMQPGTTPSIVALPSGGFEVAFAGNSAAGYDLMLYNSNGELTNTEYGMQVGTSPSITALSSGGFEVAFAGNAAAYNALMLYSSTGYLLNTEYGMQVGTTPSITGMPTGGFWAAFAGNSAANYDLMLYSSNGYLVNSEYGMQVGSSPSIAGLSSGDFVAPFAGNAAANGDLLLDNSSGVLTDADFASGI